jgi:hypothetical protein
MAFAFRGAIIAKPQDAVNVVVQDIADGVPSKPKFINS